MRTGFTSDKGENGMRSRSIAASIALLGLLATGAIAASSASASNTRRADSLIGAGSTFVSPLVSLWSKDYPSKTGVTITYGGGGSGAGVTAITNKTVDFAGSDAPLTSDQAKACGDCVQIPWALGATAIVYNVNGAKQGLHVTGPVLAQIFLGGVTKWNAPALRKLNPGVNLPDEDIKIVYRSGASGTSYNLTDYLSKVSPTWKSKIGASTTPSFPSGQGAAGSSGEAGTVSRTEGAIGYVDTAFAVAQHLRFFYVKNAAGKFAGPGLRGIDAAGATIKKGDIPPNNEVHIVNPSAKVKQAYPICTFTYVIVHKSSPKAAALRKFVFYALTQGQSFARKLLFGKMPLSVLSASEKTLKTVTG
jgi:phosphate transport system substrate-binding protein